ncbi:MAG: hypothetical protein IT294_06870 [Deltaproteobacteria bacterium]|nr:hypothetical protein [Deltaproteobacteria bacterium]
MSASDRRDLALCLAVCALLLLLPWAEPRPADDLFIALAGGRDTLAGKLGAPDDWSYTTEGRVWLNQNWGSDVLLYATHATTGPNGLLALKAALLAAAAALLAATARARGAGAPEAWLVAGVALAAGRSYIDLRPALLGLVLACACLAALARAATRPIRLAAVVAILALWANAHGSFVFGLGLLGAWTVVIGVLAPRVLPAALAACAASVALAAFANPFGVANLTHALVVGASPAWRTVAEWAPLFATDVTTFGSRWEICALAGAFVALLAARVAVGRGAPSNGGDDARFGRARAIFDAVVLLAVAVMTVRARRFVPLALVVLAGPLAAELAWWRRRLASAWPLRTLAVGLAIAAAVALPPVARRYAAANPVFAGLSPFERMVDAPTFPRDAAEFVRANGLHGRVYAAWEAEGFLRWTDTPVTVLIGGRAQQVYDETTLQLHKDLRTGAAPARDALGSYDVGLAILPMTAPYAIPLGGLVYAEGSPWAFIYSDGRHVVLADTSRAELAPTIAALEAGTLRYPTPAIAATSRMMYLASPHTNADVETLRAAAKAAIAAGPVALAYAVLGDVAMADTSSKATREYLAAERVRLAALAAPGGESLALAQARLAVARTEAALVARTVDPEGVRRTKDELALRLADMRRMLTTWAYGWDPNVF